MFLPSATLKTGACPVLIKLGTAIIPQIPKNEAVILYFFIESANGPTCLFNKVHSLLFFITEICILPMYTRVLCTSL